ncbi:hypothetical protein GCM10028857_29930 [Salinarchaeum chitinilyticum]
MTDESSDDGDSRSGARGASSDDGSEPSSPPDDADESEPVDESASSTPGDDGSGGEPPDSDDASGDESNGEPATSNDESDGSGDATDHDDAETEDDTAVDQSEPGDTLGGRPGYTEDHVTAADDADADPTSARAPTGADAPSPTEDTATTDVGTTTTASPAGGDGGGSILSGGIGGSAPPDDEEMPLTEHIEEMLTRLAIVVVVASLATLAVFPFVNDIIIQMWYDVHAGSVEACRPNPQGENCVAPHVYGPLELVLTRIRVAGLAGLLVSLPLGVYQIYRFMRPGLYPHERRYYLAAVPFSLLLGIVGMLFAYFVMLPLFFEYLISYTEGSADLAFQLADTMNLILLLMGMLAIIFQIPLLIMLAILMGITTRQWLESHRLYFWGLFFGVAFLFGPDPTGMAPVLLTATMVALFEGTLLLLRWTGR